MDLDLKRVPQEGANRVDTLLFSESAGRFIVTVAPWQKETFEKLFKGIPFGCMGQITENLQFVLKEEGKELLNLHVDQLERAWKSPFEHL